MKTPVRDKNKPVRHEINLTSKDNEKLFENEIYILSKINSMDLGNIKDTIPNMIYAGEMLNRRISLESALPGRNMIDYVRARSHLLWKSGLKVRSERVAKWLIEFHKATHLSDEALDSEAHGKLGQLEQ
ncbi:hypothetical protein ACFL42_03870, partial [Candidatus Omnitrophota bacterium]